jgi:hypothetical protein
MQLQLIEGKVALIGGLREEITEVLLMQLNIRI